MASSTRNYETQSRRSDTGSSDAEFGGIQLEISVLKANDYAPMLPKFLLVVAALFSSTTSLPPPPLAIALAPNTSPGSSLTSFSLFLSLITYPLDAAAASIEFHSDFNVAEIPETLFAI
ncbi:hypothetical protein R3P38DRAFT_3167010 [Favolaschia claudopus]|uniref:Uncharacterized protein n=1 Tax=Favolaschia claudopus TaxID=2862362 RepID=A0AAW0EEB2_9AGAR